MKESYMRQVYTGMIGDMKNLEQHYSDMAEKGWMIDKIGMFSHRYRAVPPCQKRFFVDFLPQITMFDYPENEDAQEYRRICEESGWSFIAASKQFHVFCADGENPAPIPIHTDNAIHAKIYLKACRKYELPWLIFVMLMLYFFISLNLNGTGTFLSNTLFFTAIGFLLFSFAYIWIFGFVICWYIRTKKAAKNDLPMPRVDRRSAKIRMKVSAAAMAALTACIFIGVVSEIMLGGTHPATALSTLWPLFGTGIGLLIKRQIDTKRRTRAENIGFFVIVIIVMVIIISGGGSLAVMHMPAERNSDSLDGRPALALNDVGAVTPSIHSNISVKGTPVVPVDYDYWESNGEGSVRTQVYRSVNKTLTRWLYDRFAEEFTYEFRGFQGRPPESVTALSPDESALWGAEKGMMFNYADSNGVELLLCNGKTILRLSAEGANMDLTAVNRAVLNLWRD